MATTLATIRTAVQRDLHDESAAIWTANEIDRAIARAVYEYSRVSPRERKTTLTLTNGSRNVDVTASPNVLTDLLEVIAVEWPVDRYPPTYVRYGVWAGTLVLLVDTAPATGQLSAYAFWRGLHTLDANGSTIPTQDEDLIATGAGAYAALEWASYAINRLNTGGEGAAEGYRKWGLMRLEQFQAGLAKLPQTRRLRVRTGYTAETLQRSQTTDPGPGW